MDNLTIDNIDGGSVFTVKIVPGSSRTGIGGLLNDQLKVKISAAPQKGKANQCLINFLAGKIGVKKKDVKIIAGQTNPVKKVQILGISPEILRDKLNCNKQDPIQ